MAGRGSEIAKVMAGVQNEQTNQKLRDNIVSAEMDSFMRGGAVKVKSNLNCPGLLLKTLFSLTYQLDSYVASCSSSYASVLGSVSTEHFKMELTSQYLFC